MRKNGLYLRLSIADGDLGKDNKDESNSIDNQRTLLVNFVQDRDDLSDEYIEYVDDGYSGTNFERPAFKRMIEDAKTGKIDTIIVKDFSRFGRDYIGVGDYLEQVLPILGIRFISLNNNYDSNDYLGKTMGMDMAIHNLVNNLYSKDISKKLKSALRVKWRNGQWTGGKPPFGYLRNKETGEWLIDAENNLTEVVETKNIVKTAEGAEADGVKLDVDSLVSMNMWGLTPDFLKTLEEGFKEFFEKEVPVNPLKAEYLIPTFIGELLSEGKMSVKVLRTNDTWYGMTYKEDVAAVKESFSKMLENDTYKGELFSDL